MAAEKFLGGVVGLELDAARAAGFPGLVEGEYLAGEDGAAREKGLFEEVNELLRDGCGW